MNQFILNAQVLRFVAAFMVLFGHVQHEATEAQFIKGGMFDPWMPVFFAGGVDIFFVISGFIMAHLAQSAFGKSGASLAFIKRRAIRVVPLYWLFTTGMLLAITLFSQHITHSRIDIANVLASYFFIPWENAYGGLYPILILGWTLNFEIFFYAIMAFSLYFKRSTGIKILYCIVGFFGVLGLLDLSLPAPLSSWSNPIIFEFIMGVALAQLRHRGIWLPNYWALAFIGLAIVIMVCVQAMGIAGNYWHFRPLWMGLPALLICAAAVLSPEKTAPGPLKRWLAKGGDLSYALYLSHPFTLTGTAMLWSAMKWQAPWPYVFFATLLSLIAGAAIHEWLEKPITNVLKRRFDSVRVHQTA